MIQEIHKEYSKKPKEELYKLHQSYLKRKQETITEALAASIALNEILSKEIIDLSAITPEMQEAFDISFPKLQIEDLSNYTNNQLTGIISNWKGKLFEIEVRDRLNDGEIVGDLSLADGQYATIAEDVTQPGWDLQILNEDGTIAELLQLKATNSLSYINSAFEKYPEIDVMSTSEIADLNESLINSDISIEDLNSAIETPMQPLFEGFGDNVLDTLLPGLPFFVICLSEGRHVFMNIKTANEAFANASERAIKSGLSIGAGLLTTYFTSFSILGGIVTFLTRLLFKEEEKEEKARELQLLIANKKPELLLLKETYL
tara:strand:- start:26724 stop:27674 length:951 start_codon:yes stop_codon:yes gene_type:complete